MFVGSALKLIFLSEGLHKSWKSEDFAKKYSFLNFERKLAFKKSELSSRK